MSTFNKGNVGKCSLIPGVKKNEMYPDIMELRFLIFQTKIKSPAFLYYYFLMKILFTYLKWLKNEVFTIFYLRVSHLRFCIVIIISFVFTAGETYEEFFIQLFIPIVNLIFQIWQKTDGFSWHGYFTFIRRCIVTFHNLKH